MGIPIATGLVQELREHPVRIAYVTETYPPELNGVALTVERTVRHLRARGHQVLLVRPRQSGEAANDVRDDVDEWRTAGVPIPMYRDLRFGLAAPGAVLRRLRAWAPDLVHVATPGQLGWAAVQAAQRAGLALTADFRTNFHVYSRYYGCGFFEPVVRGYLRRLHAAARVNFIPTAQGKRELEAAGFERLSVVGRGVDTERYSPAHRCARTRAAWSAGDGPVLLYAGRLAAEKNVGLALRAFDAVRERHGAAQLVVVGDGPARRRLEAQCPAARFVGVQRGHDLARHYASADVFLFPSLSDTFGNVVLEALASGLPVVAYRTAAAGQHVRHGLSGMLAEPGDEAGYVNAALSMAARQASLAAAHAQTCMAARRAALAASWDRVLADFENQLESAFHAHQATSERLACAA